MDARRTHPGTAPADARSTFKLRLILSAIALPLALVAATLFAIAVAEDRMRAVSVVAAVLCAVIALVAWFKLLALLRRRRNGLPQ